MTPSVGEESVVEGLPVPDGVVTPLSGVGRWLRDGAGADGTVAGAGDLPGRWTTGRHTVTAAAIRTAAATSSVRHDGRHDRRAGADVGGMAG
jgi:hypothetical protein